MDTADPLRVVIIGLVVLVVVCLVWWTGRRETARARREVAQQWGRRREEPRDPRVAVALFELAPEERSGDGFALDDRTWVDLDLDQVLGRLDRCISPVGSQVLYRTLRCPRLVQDPLVGRRRFADALRADAGLRAAVQACLLGARDPDAGRAVELLWRELPAPLILSRLAPLLALAAMALVVLAGAGVTSWGLLLPAFLGNSIVHYLHRRRIQGLPLAELGALLGVARSLARLGPSLREVGGPDLREGVAAAAVLRRRLAPLQAEDSLGLAQYVKIYLLLDVLAYAAAVGEIRRQLARLRGLLVAVGEVDAALAVASFLEEVGGAPAPELVSNAAAWRLRGVRHPLLDRPVANDLPGERLLVTGSNMSGKTTFLKTVGVNVVLAQSLHVVLADEYRMPFLRVLSSIGRADNIIEGRSYYLAEVESVLRLVRAASGPEPHLLLLDELFRGTNPEERVAGAAAVLRHIAREPHVVLAATHDGELVELLSDAYAVVHFADAVGEHGLLFDYTLRPGPCRTRNAIALLEHVGYPPEVVARARELVGPGDRTR